MNKSNNEAFTIGKQWFKYLNGDLLIESEGVWWTHESFPTYELAYAEAEEIVAEYNAMGQGEV